MKSELRALVIHNVVCPLPHLYFQNQDKAFCGNGITTTELIHLNIFNYGKNAKIRENTDKLVKFVVVMILALL